MELEKPIRTLDQISDSELADCLDGSTSVALVRKLLNKNLAPDGWIWDMDFGDDFAKALESFISYDEDEEAEEYITAWENNRSWGERIADNVNDALSMEKPNEYKE